MLIQNQALDVLAGSSWVRQFWFQRTLPNNSVESVGGPGWGCEFALLNPQNPQEAYSYATVANNKIAWVAPGIVWVAFAAAETVTWTWARASWYLDLVAPNTSVDPLGYRATVLRGTLRCESRAPVQPYVYAGAA